MHVHAGPCLIRPWRFEDKASLAAALRPELGPGTVVLLKASRGAALEDVLAGLPVETQEA